MITRTHSERRICFLREAGFPFLKAGKTPQVYIQVGGIFYSPNLTFILLSIIIIIGSSYKIRASELADGPRGELELEVQGSGTQGLRLMVGP